MDAFTQFFAERVFGPDRAAKLVQPVPATAAAQAERDTARAAAIRTRLARIDVAEKALITELEAPADPGDLSITAATPQAITGLLTDPRADHNQQPDSGPAPTSEDHVDHLTGHTGPPPRARTRTGWRRGWPLSG